MLVAIFWQQLPIQIVVSDSVADSIPKSKPAYSNLLPDADSKRQLLLILVTICAPGSETNQALALFKKW